MNESADLRAQLDTLEAQRAAAETVAATAGGRRGQAGGLLLDDTAFPVKEGRGVLPWRG